ncbi:AraC family transcriptional regulator [Segetibacter sp. 3557_3]|uniref:helix-turn-helix domain-containing protein n=1 Tax=Segetibacter sp. 3557_3 TaxID=2547429 RepID=UPI001058F786|nr:helix-turn-helix transcriptional regulator [Segetibacter sp. 3557_3]TDH28640.1 AraC family transcriptional regulator [Segetibacter sp. 3557_3]
MKKPSGGPRLIESISEVHRILSLPKPEHSLISLVRHSEVVNLDKEDWNKLVFNFYNISMKKSFKGKMRYGKNYYDFDEGTMSFVSPGQVISVDNDDSRDCAGWSLFFHPDFILNYPLGKNIRNYGFFSYEVNEALHLSDKEEQTIEQITTNIRQEYHSSIDQFSQDVMVSQLELLLNYCNRYYNRQFITRKTATSDLLVQLEDILAKYFNGEQVGQSGLPTVQYLSEQLHLSPNYLSDMLRTLTGLNTQQHIHRKLIEKAKEALTTTTLSVSEIAYQLGFEFPQSFNKLFKSKTNLSPLEFRSSFN